MTGANLIRLGATFALLAAPAAFAGDPPAAAPANAGASAAPASTPIARQLPDSLMFTIDERNEIESRQSGGDQTEGAGGNLEIENATLYLSTILYSGPKDWKIWVNGVPVGPEQQFQAFQVTGIAPNYVELLVPLSAQGMRPVRLQPNQTFIANSGTIVEGQVAP